MDVRGGKIFKYFLNFEKSRQKQSIIKELITDNCIFDNTIDIMGVMCDFYLKKKKKNSLNEVSDNCIDEYLSSVELDYVLGENESNFCEQFPSSEECTVAVMHLKLNKSPGLDGLTNEFY